MNGGRRILLILGALVAAGFLVGIYGIFQARFSAGDLYPPYSSLRADPLGTRVLYEALARLPDRSVSRVHRPLDKVELGPGALLLLGVPSAPFPIAKQDRTDYIDFARGGGRVVVAYRPMARFAYGTRYLDDIEEEPAAEGEESDLEKEADAPRSASIWGLRMHALPRPATQAIRAADQPESFPERLACRTELGLEILDDQWTPVYAVDGTPVMVTRTVGRGSMVVATVAYFTSNEAMRTAPASALLSWLLGSQQQIYFLETIHGVASRTGVVELARSYGLTPLLIGLLILGALFVWKNASPLCPPPAAEGSAQAGWTATGEGSHQALENLVRSQLSGARLLAACRDAWRHLPATHSSRRVVSEHEVDDVLRLSEKGHRTPVSAYNALCTLLAARSGRAPTKPNPSQHRETKTK